MKLIVIDPGHDREEPGARQIDGESEYAYTLALAQAVQQELTTRYECRAVLTRETAEGMVPGPDLAAELKARGELPNEVGADFFLSLHHNAGPRAARGAELYIWTDKRRADGSLLWLPAVGADGTVNHTAPRSYAIAQVMQPILKDGLGALGIPWHGPDVQCADFAVLRYPNLPCALLETHYGTNGRDDEIADQPGFIAAAARVIAEALGKGLALPVLAPDPVAEIARLKTLGLIDSDHDPKVAPTWGEFATVLNRLLAMYP